MSKETSVLSMRVFDDVLGDPTPDPEASLRVKAQLRRRIVSSRRRRSVAGAGLVIGIATLCAILVTSALLPESSAPSAESSVSAVANLGAPLSEGLIEFPSGARVSIASDSIIHLLSDDASGTILRVIRGEVMAKVETRESSRPFLILAEDVQVKVVGTIFVVASDAHYGVRVRGYEGTVWVSRGGDQSVVGAGEVWPARVAPLVTLNPADIAERLHLVADVIAQPEVVQPDAGTASEVPVPTQLLAASHATIKRAADSEASFAEALAFERHGRDARALALYRLVSATEGIAQEDALFAVGKILRTRLHRSKEALAAFEKYRDQFPTGRYAQAVDVHILDLVVSRKDWERVDAEASRFLSVHGNDPRAPHFRRSRIKARLHLGDCAGLAEDLALTPAALPMPGLLQMCPNSL